MVSGFRTSSVLLCGARNRSADSSIRSCANTLSAHFSSGRLQAESAAGSSSTPSLALRPLRPRTQPLRQLVEHVRHLVAPVALRRRLRPHVPHRRPEAERAVAPRRRRRPAGTARRPASRGGRRPPPTGAATGPRGRPTARSRDRRTSASATNPSSARKNRHWCILPAAAANLRVGLRLRSVSLSTNRPGWMWIPPCRCCVFSTCRRLRLPRRVRRTTRRNGSCRMPTMQAGTTARWIRSTSTTSSSSRWRGRCSSASRRGHGGASRGGAGGAHMVGRRQFNTLLAGTAGRVALGPLGTAAAQSQSRGAIHASVDARLSHAGFASTAIPRCGNPDR